MKKTFIFLSVFLPLIPADLFCQDSIIFMSYNLLNYASNDTGRDADFRTVVSSVNPDILVVQEITSQGAVNQFLSNVMNTFGETYAAGTFIDGYDTDNAIFYKTSKFGFVSNVPIKTNLRDINEFTVFHLFSVDTLHIFSVHLKSSTGSANETERAAEVDSLRKRTNTFSQETNFIVCGDFNIYNSSEQAYQKLLQNNASDNGNFIDPRTMPGNWNNSSYSSFHTQSTRTRSFGGGSTGGMDDRFDLILHSMGIHSANDIELLSGSYIAYGNDGNHYNDSINRPPNAAVPQNVANALHNASDHLPVFISLVFTHAIQNVKTTLFSHSSLEEKTNIFNYPNPFTISTTIEYVIPGNFFVTLAIFDLYGNKIANLVNEYKEKGCYQTEFIASPFMSNGMYYYLLRSGNTIISRKIFMAK